ncbi:MAG: DUF411 domain-containing protein [Candidatus Kariarchaeaceae archaeon]
MSDKIPGAYDHLKKKQKPDKESSGSPVLYKATIIVLVLFVGLLYSGVLVDRPNHDMDYNPESQDIWESDIPIGIDLVMFADPNCGCCHLYIDYLEEYGFTTRTEYPSNLADIKDYQGIPKDARSCHTIKVGDYFIEGHIPIEAVQHLLSTNPGIDGISLPQMPAGSPGMSGIKSGDFEILSIKDGQVTGVFLTI